MLRYVASLDAQWNDFTEKHKEIREEIERKLRDYLQGGRPNPIAIRGPIGQGKTQLLYEVFKFVWKNGGIAFYATLDKLLPEKDITATEFAQKIDADIADRIEKLKVGRIEEIPFLTNEMKQWIKESNKNLRDYSKVVLLIDEMERSYEKLLNRVKTDDRSPFGYWLEHTPYFPIAAFAPLSHYEALYGEAERRRWDSISLPPITAKTLREKDKDLGNFVWWVSRGRLGISYKAMDSVRRKNLTEFKEFEDLVNELGPIAGVPAIDLDNLAKLKESFSFVVRLFPQNKNGHHSVIEGEIINNEKFITLLRNSLREEGWPDRSIEFLTYYFKIVTDALSQNNKILIPLDRYDEILAPLKLSVDLAIEHETLEHPDVKNISERFRELERNLPQFFYTKLYKQLQELSEGKGYILSYQEIAKLFPMPITSPAFGNLDTIDKAKEIILSKALYDYVAKDEIETAKGLITFLYFPNEVKLNDYLRSREIIDFLPPNKGIVCILLDGDSSKVYIQGVASWLKDVRRFRIEVPSKMLGDFLTYFIAWSFNEQLANGYIDNLRDTLYKQAEELWSRDKELSRKISHYRGMLETYLENLKASLTLDKEKYSAKASQDGIRRYGGRYARFPDIVGVAFVKSKNERDLVYRFRKLILDSSELKSLRSGIGGLLEDASVKRTGLSLVLDNVHKDFEKDFPLLLALAHQTQEEDFINLSEQSEAKMVLKGIYRFARNKISPSRIKEIKSEINKVLDEIKKLKEARKNIIKDLGVTVRESKSEKNESQINELEKIIEDAENCSDYIRWLLLEFGNVILEDFKNQYLHPDQTTLSKWERRTDIAKNYFNYKKDIDKLKDETFEWIGKTKEEVMSELNSGYEDALETLTRYQREVEWENVDILEWTPFEDKVDALVALIKRLKDIDEKLQEVLKLANLVNEQIMRDDKKWN